MIFIPVCNPIPAGFGKHRLCASEKWPEKSYVGTLQTWSGTADGRIAQAEWPTGRFDDHMEEATKCVRSPYPARIVVLTMVRGMLCTDSERLDLVPEVENNSLSSFMVAASPENIEFAYQSARPDS